MIYGLLLEAMYFIHCCFRIKDWVHAEAVKRVEARKTTDEH